MPRKQNANVDYQGVTRPINLPAPVNPGDGVPKSYVDERVTGIVSYIESPVRVVATANVNTAAPGANIGGVALAAGNRVLLTGQTIATQNGTWIWHGAAEALTRSTDTFQNGSAVIVSSDDTVHPRSIWVQTTDNPEVGVTALTFVNVGSLSIAGHGLEREGETIKLKVPVAIEDGGTGNSTATTALKALGGTTTATAEIGNGALTSFKLAHTLGAYPLVILINNATKLVEDCTVEYTANNEVTLSGEAWVAAPPAAKAYTVVLIG